MAHDHFPPAHRPSGRAGYDALQGWDTSLDVEPEEIATEPLDAELLDAELLDLGLLEEADAGIEWGSDGALARALLSVALTDVAPSEVRERVLSTVDAVLREPAAVPAFPADAAPVTTLSGVFEKRRPTTEAASCIAARIDGPRADAAFDDGVRHAAERDCIQPSASSVSVVAGLESAALEPACVEATFLESDDIEVASLEPTGAEPASFEGEGPLCVTATSGVHCSGGPMVGGRCRGKLAAIDVAANPIIRGAIAAPSSAILEASSLLANSRVTSRPITNSPVAGEAALNPVAATLVGSPFRVGVSRSATPVAARAALGSGSAGAVPRFEPGVFVPASEVAVASNLDAAFAAAERSTSARLRDGVVSSAFNFAQLAAAIVVGIVIGKAAHLIVASENAVAWNTRAQAEGGLRAEPSRTPEAARASAPVEAAEPGDSLEPRSARNTPRPRANRGGRASSSANAPVRPAAAASARPAAHCSLAASAAVLPPAPLPAATALACAPSGLPLARVAPLSHGLSRRSPPAPTADNVQPPLAPSSDDWLGEQLAILGRAERSILEDDPEGAVRSLDEYEARFPDGLLDPQMASIRQRVEERFTAFIFP